jgi:hypothetical protein
MERVVEFGIVVVVARLFLNSGFCAELREWTHATDGRNIPADFLATKDANTVTIEMQNGRNFDVPLSSLSPGDGVYAKDAAAKMAGSSGSTGAPTGTKPPLPEGETTVTLSKAPICCGECVDAVARIRLDEKNPIPAGVTILADLGEEVIIAKAPSGKDAQAAFRAEVAAGFYGVSDHSAVVIQDLKVDDFAADTMLVRDTHLCFHVQDIQSSKDFLDFVSAAPGIRSSRFPKEAGPSECRGMRPEFPRIGRKTALRSPRGVSGRRGRIRGTGRNVRARGPVLPGCRDQNRLPERE